MAKYFDKDFFKFLMGFVAIIAFSLIIILFAQVYKDQKIQTANVIDAANMAGNPTQ